MSHPTPASPLARLIDVWLRLHAPQGSAALPHGIILAPITSLDGPEAEALVELNLAAMGPEVRKATGIVDAVKQRSRCLGAASRGVTVAALTPTIDGAFVARAAAILTPSGDDAVELSYLYVHPEEQGRGIGTAILHRLCAASDAVGVPVRLGVLKADTVSRLYERLGWVRDGENTWEYTFVRSPVPCMDHSRSSSPTPVVPRTPPRAAR